MNPKTIQIKTWEDTEITKWTQRGFQQTLEWNQGNYKKYINQIKQAVEDVKKGA
jgi:hypothetical protein